MMMRDEIHLRFSINLAKKDDDDTKDDKKNNTTNNEDDNKNVVFSPSPRVGKSVLCPFACCEMYISMRRKTVGTLFPFFPKGDIFFL